MRLWTRSLADKHGSIYIYAPIHLFIAYTVPAVQSYGFDTCLNWFSVCAILYLVC